MSIEPACVRFVTKPWGRMDLHPFAENDTGGPIGELWFTRGPDAPRGALLLKVLFTSEPLSIQVHPTDAYAASLGLPNGKSEAWAVLAAEPGAEVALGLRRPLKSAELRAAIEDGSIADLVDWRPVRRGDVIAVPAGTIHAIGAGLVLAEIQQNSDTTFRLFDFGRGRDLHVDEAVMVAHAGPAEPSPPALALGPGRTLLVANAGFVLERIELTPDSIWRMDAGGESWLLVLEGDAVVDEVTVSTGQAVYLDAVRPALRVGPDGFVGLLAYAAREPNYRLLEDEHNRQPMRVGQRVETVRRAPERARASLARATDKKARS